MTGNRSISIRARGDLCFDSTQAASVRRSKSRRASRPGVIIVLTAILMVFMLAMIAFAVDIGYIANARTEIQRATDAAAYAGAGDLVYGTAAAGASADQFLLLNKVAGQQLKSANAVYEFGNWNASTRAFTVTNTTPNAIRVTASANQQPLFFGNAIGKSSFSVTGKSVATYQPRDIGLVLDYSGSMAYDSQFRNIGLLGQTAIENNLKQIYQQLGSPVFGTLTMTPVSYGNSSTSNSSVINKFKLNTVAYPYPGGSWSNYVDYVQTDSYVQAAGYRNKYGYLTWVNYILSQQCGNDDTPALKNCSVQPVTALKDAVDVFLSFLSENSTDDRVALSIYTYSDNTAILESGLTKIYSTISNICRGRQAGHYVGGTNISAGMTKARIEVQTNARAGAQKMLIVMTDGVVNLPTGNTTTDKAKVITEANLCAAAKIPVVTIALGAYADTALMQQVADITGGVAFVVPGGQPIAQVQAQLEAVFAQVAADRPLKLVQ
jgi:Flp pilus assembly protein TadG